MFSKVLGGKQIDFPAEYNYGLISNKWLLKEFSGKIGLIGAGPKLKIIKKLLKNNEYKKYLGIDKFLDYISIPQKFEDKFHYNSNIKLSFQALHYN